MTAGWRSCVTSVSSGFSPDSTVRFEWPDKFAVSGSAPVSSPVASQCLPTGAGVFLLRCHAGLYLSQAMGFPNVGLSLMTCRKSAVFRRGAKLVAVRLPKGYPYLPHYRERSLSPASFTPWIIPHSLRSAYSGRLPENPWGFCSSQCLSCVRVGFRLYSGGIVLYR